jgi:hypothetical protein
MNRWFGSRKPSGGCELDRQQRSSLALRRLRLQCQRRIRRPQRLVGISASNYTRYYRGAFFFDHHDSGRLASLLPSVTRKLIPTRIVTLRGGYTWTATTLSGGAATVSIPGGKLSTGSRYLAVNYTRYRPESPSGVKYLSGAFKAYPVCFQRLSTPPTHQFRQYPLAQVDPLGTCQRNGIS